MKKNFYDIALKIDELVKEYSDTNLTEIESYFIHKGIKDYFLKKLAQSSDPLPWLKPLKLRGYFKPENNPPPQKVPDKEGYFLTKYWNVLGFLENVAVKNTKNPSNEINNILVEIVNSIANCRKKDGERIENFRTDWMLIKIIFKLPVEKITEEHIKFIGTSLKSRWTTTLVPSEIRDTALPYLVENKAKKLILILIDTILDYKPIIKKWIEKEFTEYSSIMDKYWLYETLKEYKPEIAKLCDIKAAEIALNKMIAIINEDKNQFNNIWIPTIEDHPKKTFPDRYECQLVHFVRDMFELANPKEIREKIKELLTKKHPIFKRIALHTINHHYKDLKDIFWDLDLFPFYEPLLKHELYELLKKNCTSFTMNEIKKILEWIENREYYIRDEIKKDKDLIDKALAYRKKEWLSALLETEDKDVKVAYKKDQKIYPEEIEYPGLDFGAERTLRSGAISPIDKNELLNKPNEEIAEYLKEYKEERGWRNPSIGGLSNTFRSCVSENPEKFANNMKPFLKVQRVYQHALLWGLDEAWRLNKDFKWDNIFNFILKIMKSNNFWNEKYEEGSNYRNWIISQIADLIEDGTKDDKHTFNNQLLPKAENILLILSDRVKSHLPGMKDLVTSVLNSPKGRVFSAMINYSILCSQTFKKEQEDKWVEAIKEDFNKRLNRKVEPSLEFSVSLGKYLAYMYYLDKNWVTNNINKIFPKDNGIHWKAAFTGYLFYHNIINKDIYLLIRKNNHYIKAIQTEFGDDTIINRLVQHICVGYLKGLEKLDDDRSLISLLFKKPSVNQLSAIVNFFWMQKDNITDEVRIKVKPIWKVLFDILSQREESPEYQKIISNISKWLSLIDEIDDEILKWLKLSARYIQVNFNAPFFIEYLLKHAPCSPKKVGELYLEMLNSDVYPEYKMENIQEIVQILYKKKQKKIADKICNMYGAKGLHFLRTIYEKHRHNIQ